MAILETRDLRKTYTIGDNTVNAVDGISLRIEKGELVSIMGPSGSGKTTLLNLLGCLDRPTSGTVLVDDRVVTTLSDSDLNVVRLKKVGFIFQRVNLIPILTAHENVELPMEIANVPSAERSARAQSLLEAVGLGKRAGHRPSQLSSGEQQRVGIARSLANNPSVILADEPTGNLDSNTSHEICELLTKLNTVDGYTIIMVTHNPVVGMTARRRIVIRDGKIFEDV